MQRASSPTRLWRLFPLAAIIVLGALLPSGAGAAKPVSDRFPVEAEFDYPPLSDQCGFPVTIGFDGDFALKLFTKADGTAREIDTQPHTKITFRSETGAVSFPFSATLHIDYPEGTGIGGPAIGTLTGRGFGQSPADGPGRGRLVMTGTIEDVDDAGIPLVRFTDLVSSSGNYGADTAKICAALAG